MKILIAPDKFRDAIDAEAAAAALAEGVRDALPDARVTLQPLGDGGEGSGRILGQALGAAEHSTAVRDPLGRERFAAWWLQRDQRLAVIEMAEASGLRLLQPQERDPTRTTSYGVGQLMRAALDAGAERLVVCVGGSATVDGGAGCLQALGFRLFDANGSELTEPVPGGSLTRVARIEPSTKRFEAVCTVVSDVDNPLIGSDGAAAVYGPQKGASEKQIAQLDDALEHWAKLLDPLVRGRVATLPGGGAAGGLPVALVAALRGVIEPGFDYMARQLDLVHLLHSHELCLTGEGRLDRQTGHGKLVAGLAALARTTRTATLAFVGDVVTNEGESVEDVARRLGLRRVVVVTPEGAPLQDALRNTAQNLRRAAGQTLSEFVKRP